MHAEAYLSMSSESNLKFERGGSATYPVVVVVVFIVVVVVGTASVDDWEDEDEEVGTTGLTQVSQPLLKNFFNLSICQILTRVGGTKAYASKSF